MKKSSSKTVSLILILAMEIILISANLTAYTEINHKQKKEPISPQQLITNLKQESFQGKKASIRFYDQKLVKFIKEISRISGLSFKISPDINRRITLVQLNTPWDQILSRLLKKADLQIYFNGTYLQIQAKYDKPKKIEMKSLTKILSKTSKKYSGEKGDFIFNNADLKNVILFFAENYKLNIIMDPGINGRVTCRLIQVPWDQALEVILRRHGLAIIQDGSIVNVKKY